MKKRIFASVAWLALVLGLGGTALQAADATTGIIVGRIVGSGTNRALAGATVDAASPSGRYRVRTDADGRFTIVGVAPDTYTLAVSLQGYDSKTLAGVTVLPGARAIAETALARALKEIGRVTARGTPSGFGFGETQDVFRVSGDAARGLPSASSSGLGSFTQGTVQGAVATVPGVQQDQFSNVILQGGRVEDTVFSFDDVPVPQALIAEPGGNIVGAQLPTTGLGYTTVTTGGSSSSSNQGLAGVIDQIPSTGVYPAQTLLTLAQGIVPGSHASELQSRWATPDLRHRYAFDASLDNEQIQYGDGKTFYAAEAATYGISISKRATWSVSANTQHRIGKRDELSFSTLEGQAVYDQYGTPIAGTTYGTYDGATTPFPGGSPNSAVDTPTRIRGSYAVQKLQALRSYDKSTVRLQAYGSQYGSRTVAPFFDDLSFPDGPISYSGRQNARLYGLGLDVQDIASDRHEISYGAEVRTQSSIIDQLVPTLDSHLTAQPVLNSYLAYLSERWSPTKRLVMTGTVRANGTWVVRSDGHRYGVSALDPHLGLNYRVLPNLALLATFDHTTQAPNPLEAERTDSANPTPFVALAPEAGDSFELALQHDGPIRARLGYYAKAERNLVDVLPFNFRGASQSGGNASAVGVPTNAGNLLVHGVTLSVGTKDLSLNATYTRGFSSSASQFGYNALNAPAIAAGHLFPIGYVPDFSAVASYDVHLSKHLTISPSLSYETGYPYGNGRMVYAFDPVTNKPVRVPNDNNINPGFNYYFLSDPAKPFDAATNPYVATLGTPEGDDPNTLRSTPQLLASLRLRADLGRTTTLVVDVLNLFGNANPTQYQGNPYLIGPPGYAGGAYGASLCQQIGGAADCARTQPYTLGNGVPTRDGQHQALPFQYGRDGYIGSSFANARAIYVRVQQRL